MSAGEISLVSGVTVVVYRPSTPAVTVLPQGTPISGIDGDDGADGKTVRNGAGVPSNALGVDGDSYINTSNWSIYMKSGGVWVFGTSLIGPQGSAVLGGAHTFLLGGM